MGTDETQTGAVLRQGFLAELEAQFDSAGAQPEGGEAAGDFYNLRSKCTTNTSGWIEEYEKDEWDVTQRGQFPFDVDTWVNDLVDLYKASADPTVTDGFARTPASEGV